MIKVKQNIWGNWNCYSGSTKVQTFANEWDAQIWIDSTTGKVSPKSELKPTAQ